MSYNSISFTPFDILPASDLNILAANDASFHDGTGISNLEIGSGHTSVKNDYKFSAYRNAPFNFTSSFVLLTFDTKTFDTGTNYNTSTGKFTAPVTGFYLFNWQVYSNTFGDGFNGSLYKNGVEVSRGAQVYLGGSPFTTGGENGIKLVSATAGDFFQVYIASDTTRTGTPGAEYNYFEGFLLSQT